MDLERLLGPALALLSSYLGRPSQVCSCEGAGRASERVLQLLERQLERCGPANLAPPPPPTPPCERGWAFLGGLLAGLLISLIAALGLLVAAHLRSRTSVAAVQAEDRGAGAAALVLAPPGALLNGARRRAHA